jgi:hypothetical protein
LDTRGANGLTNIADIGISFKDGDLHLNDTDNWSWDSGTTNNGKTVYTATHTNGEQVSVTVDDAAVAALNQEVLTNGG